MLTSAGPEFGVAVCEFDGVVAKEGGHDHVISVTHVTTHNPPWRGRGGSTVKGATLFPSFCV